MSLEAHLVESMTDIVFAKDLNGRYIADTPMDCQALHASVIGWWLPGT